MDYLLLDRPLAYILTDFEQYQAKRGFVFDNPLAYMPGEILYGLNDLTRFLSHVATGEDLYREERHRLLPIMHNRCEGYCQRLLEYLKIQKKD